MMFLSILVIEFGLLLGLAVLGRDRRGLHDLLPAKENAVGLIQD